MQKTYTNCPCHFPQKIQKGKRRDLPGHRLLAAAHPFVSLSFSPSPCPLVRTFPFPRFPHFPQGSAGKSTQAPARQEVTLRGGRQLPTQKLKKGKRPLPISPAGFPL